MHGAGAQPAVGAGVTPGAPEPVRRGADPPVPPHADVAAGDTGGRGGYKGAGDPAVSAGILVRTYERWAVSDRECMGNTVHVDHACKPIRMWALWVCPPATVRGAAHAGHVTAAVSPCSRVQTHRSHS